MSRAPCKAFYHRLSYIAYSLIKSVSGRWFMGMCAWPMIQKRQKSPPHTECSLLRRFSTFAQIEWKQTEFAIKLFAYRAENWVVFVSGRRSLMYGVCAQMFNMSNQSVALTWQLNVLGISLSLWLPPAECKRRCVHISPRVISHKHTPKLYTEPSHIWCQPNWSVPQWRTRHKTVARCDTANNECRITNYVIAKTKLCRKHIDRWQQWTPPFIFCPC